MHSLLTSDVAVFEKYLDTVAMCAWLPPELPRLVGGALRVQRAAYAATYARAPLPELNAQSLATPDAHVQGAPLLPAADFPVDTAAACALWEELSLVLATGSEKAAAAVSRLMDNVRADADLAPAACRAFMHDDNALFDQWSSRLPEAPALVHFLAQAGLTPQLAAISAALASGHDASRVWEHGHCPHCGRAPFMGELHGKEGRRLHACSFCGCSWRAARLQCPYCLERGEAQLRAFSSDSVPGFEVQVCTSCKSYIKLADLREADNPLPAALLDLTSLPLDILAGREGFARPTPSSWGF